VVRIHDAEGAPFTINVELVQFSPDVHLLLPALEQLVLEAFHYPRTRKVELGGKIRNVHVDSLAIGFVVDVLISATKGSGIACCGEEDQIFGRRRRKIDEAVEQISLTEGAVYDRNVHTSSSSCRSRDRAPPEVGRRFRCKGEGN